MIKFASAPVFRGKVNLHVKYKNLKNYFFDFLKQEGFHTNYQVAQKTGISEATLNEVATDKTKLSTKNILRACKALNCNGICYRKLAFGFYNIQTGFVSLSLCNNK